MKSLCSLQCFRILLKLPYLGLMRFDRLCKAPQSSMSLLNLLPLSLERGQRQHVGDVGVLIELEPLVFLQQLGRTKRHPDHPGSIILVQGQSTNCLNVIEDSLGKDQYTLPRIIGGHPGRRKDIIEGLLSIYPGSGLSPREQELLCEDGMRERLRHQGECIINSILNHSQDLGKRTREQVFCPIVECALECHKGKPGGGPKPAPGGSVLLLVMFLHDIFRVGQTVRERYTSLREAVELCLVGRRCVGHPLSNHLIGISRQHHKSHQINTITVKGLVCEGLDPSRDCRYVSEGYPPALNRIPGTSVSEALDPGLQPG